MASLAVCLDVRERAHEHVDRALQVHSEHPVPVFQGRLVHGAEEVHAGCVADDVYLSKYPQSLVRCGGNGCAITYVKANWMDMAAGEVAELRESGLQLIVAPVSESDVRTRGGQRSGNSKANAARRAGDECYFAAQTLHGVHGRSLLPPERARFYSTVADGSSRSDCPTISTRVSGSTI